MILKHIPAAKPPVHLTKPVYWILHPYKMVEELTNNTTFQTGALADTKLRSNPCKDATLLNFWLKTNFDVFTFLVIFSQKEFWTDLVVNFKFIGYRTLCFLSCFLSAKYNIHFQVVTQEWLKVSDSKYYLTFLGVMKLEHQSHQHLFYISNCIDVICIKMLLIENIKYLFKYVVLNYTPNFFWKVLWH